jgi:NADPH2:quinone reductase
VKAFVVNDFDKPGEVGQAPDPVPEADEILVRVRAASVNPYDAVAATGGTRSFAETRLPFIPGVDGAGTVEALGAGVETFAVGDEVILNAGTKSYWGGGTFAELVEVPVTAAVHKPAGLSFEEASTIPQTGLTALAAIDNVDPQPGQVVVVSGATGGVGSWFTRMAAARGARVVALSRRETSAVAVSAGASDVVDYSQPDPEGRLRVMFPDGVDAFADFAGNDTLIESVSAIVKPGGRVTSSIARLDVEAYAQRGLTASKSDKTDFARMIEILDLIGTGQVEPPQIAIIGLDDLSEALKAARAKHTPGKVVVRIP